MFNPMVTVCLLRDKIMFEKEHPKFIEFLKTIGKDKIELGTIIQFDVISPNGEKISTNIKLTESDLTTLKDIKDYIEAEDNKEKWNN